MKRVSLFLLIITTGFSVTNASATEPDVKVGPGVRSCAQFAQHYLADPEHAEEVYFTWVQGFLTGFHVSAMDRGDRPYDLTPPGRDTQWQKKFVRDHCAEHPTASLFEATQALNREVLNANKK